MKKENVFETDSPTIEMETQTIRRSQNGNSSPFFNGNTNQPVTGFTVQPNTGNQYAQQNGFSQFNAFSAPQTASPSYTPQGYIQPQGFTPFNTPYFNGIQAPFYAYQHPAAFAVNQPIPSNYFNTPFSPAVQGPWAFAPNHFGTYNTVQPTTAFQPVNPIQQQSSYQPAIHLADGRYTMVPTQQTATSSRNGASSYKQNDQDFTSWTPTVNILETDRAFKIEVCVPGVSRENCRVHIDKYNVLRVTGTRRWNQETDAVGFTKKEFNYGSFNCSFVLTETMQREKITSSCRNGILIISIPKKETTEVDTQTQSEISIN